jgi:rare lipoprotein A
MRKLLRTVVLSLTLGAGAALPAAADSRQGEWRDWSEGGPRYFNTPPAAQPQRQRAARATYSDSWDDEDARPRRRAYDAGDRIYERRYTKRQHAARAAKKTRRHQIARQPAKSQQRKAAVHRVPPAKRPAVAAPKLAPAVAAVKPAPAAPSGKRSLSTDGPRGSHLKGMASYYWQGQRVASGGRFDPSAMTAAHKTLPFGTRVRVTHLGNGRSVEVKINDRGPFIAGRIIDLSKGAAGVIGMTAQGIARVAVEVLGR